MRKITSVFVFFIWTTHIFGQTSYNKINHKSYEKYVYTINILNHNDQTAFKIKGLNGLITTLHGFYSLKRSGANFRNYEITQIKNSSGEIIFKKEKGKPQILVSNVDIDRDLAFFPWSSIPQSEGFEIDSIESLKLGAGNGRIYSCGNSNRIKAISIDILEEKEKFREQINNTNDLKYFNKLKIPSLDCDLLMIPNSSLFPGNSGSPIVNSENLKVLAIAQASNNPNWAWGIIPNLKKLKKYEQLSKNEINILDSAYFLYLKNPNIIVNFHSNSKPLNLKTKEIKRKTGLMVYTNLDTIGYFYRNYQQPIKAKKSYPFLQAIPQAYLFFKQTNSKTDILNINGFINPQNNEPPIIRNSRFKLRFSLNKYIYSKQFIKVVALYSNYLNSKSNALLNELTKEAQILHQLVDSIEPTKKEYGIWKMQKFDFFYEQKSLLDLIAEETKNLATNKNQDRESQKGISITTDNLQKINNQDKTDSLYILCIKEADNLFNKAKYEKAHTKYLEAISYNRTSYYPKQKLKEIEKKLQKQNLLKEKVNNLNKFVGDLIQEKIHDYQAIYILPNIEYSTNITGINKENFSIIFKYGMSNSDFILNSNYSSFPIGKYKYLEAEKVIEILDLTMNEIYKMYSNVISEKGISITYIGHADGIPFSRLLSYDPNDFGKLSNVIIKDNLNYESSFKSALNGNSDQKNRALAFLRAYSAKCLLEENNEFLKKNSNILHVIHKEKGGQYRCVEVRIEFKIDINKISKP